MKLYHTPTSPFVRKVMLAAHELGLADRIETIHLRPTPIAPDGTLSSDNPLSKIPTLVLDDGSTLYDSHVICEYLDSLGAHRLIPERGPARFTALRREALAGGITEAGVLVFYETRTRPAERRWDAWIAGQTQKILQGLDALEREARSIAEAPIDLGHLGIAAGLGWLEFREIVPDLFAGRPRLEVWYRSFCERPSMQATVPHA